MALFFDGWGYSPGVNAPLYSASAKYLYYGSGAIYEMVAPAVTPPPLTPNPPAPYWYRYAPNYNSGGGFAQSRTLGVSDQWIIGLDLVVGYPLPIGAEGVIFRLESGPATNSTYAPNANTQLLVTIAPDGILRFYQWASGLMDGTDAGRGLRLYVTPDPPALPNDGLTSTYIEIKVQFGPHGSLEVHYNDAAVITLSNTNIGNSTLGWPDRFSFYWKGVSNNGVSWANVYASTGALDSGGNPQGFKGPCRVTSHRFTSNERQTWTRNTGASDVACINENPADGDATYIEGTSGQEELFATGKMPCFGRILGVSLCAMGRRSVAGHVARTSYVCRQDPVGHAETTLQLATDWADGYAINQTPPSEYSLRNAGERWTDGEIEQAWWGLYAAGPGTARVTQMWVEKLTSLRNVPYQCGQLGSYSY